MSRSALKAIQAAAGAAGDPVYVDDVFSTHLYQGNGSTQTITNGIDLAGEGGLVWIKNRTSTSGIAGHFLLDTVQPSVSGSQAFLSSNSTAAADGAGNMVTSFNSNGFGVGANNRVGYNGTDYVSWTFRKQPGFFDVVTWTGDGTNNRAISHSLGSTPGMLIIKRLDSSSPWTVIHRSLSSVSNNYIYLDETAAESTGNVLNGWSSTSFTIGTYNNVYYNGSGGTYVAYIFAHDAQDFGEDSDEAIIKCGSYTGNGSSSGPTINLGFEPQWLLVKAATGNDGWVMWDIIRGMVVGGNDAQLQANYNGTEYSGYSSLDINPTGFTYTHNGAQYNGSGETYIYMAIRRPHKPASEFSATDLFKTVTGRSDSVSPSYVTGFVNDMGIQRATGSTDNNFIMARQAGNKYSYTNSNTTSFNNTGSSIAFDYMNGALDYFSSAAYRWWGWRRAPGFFDVVTWKGTGSAKTIPHNLGVAPEMIWVFTRDAGERHAVYSKVSGNQAWLDLSYTYSANADSAGAYWNSTDPTASVFSVGTNYRVNDSSNSYGLYYGFLFASVAGISKVGSYTGTGSDINVDCGFSNGARFVLIKTTTWSSGHWFLFDSERGISSGNDPYIVLDTTSTSEEGALDAIDPLSSGFIVKGTAGYGMNKSGETYLFYAIA